MTMNLLKEFAIVAAEFVGTAVCLGVAGIAGSSAIDFLMGKAPSSPSETTKHASQSKAEQLTPR
jgi:hypothetical protein